MNIILAILIFSVIIVIHELGHFLLAKSNGIFVKEFSIGMGPRLISLVKTANGYRPRFLLSQHDFEHTIEWQNTTKYSWKLLPIGGSCMMLGEDELVEDDRAFNKKGVWARISVVFAGPLFNFILAFILSLIVIGNVGYDPAKINDVSTGSPAEEIGIQSGDVIKEINGNHILNARDLYTYFQFNSINGDDISLTYARDGHKITVHFMPVKKYKLGFTLPSGDEAVITDVIEDFPLANAGLKDGDIIVKINDTAIGNGTELYNYFRNNLISENALTITYQRNGIENTVVVTPKWDGVSYDLGINADMSRIKVSTIDTIKYSGVEVGFWIKSTVQSIGMLFERKVGVDDMAGPVGIVNIIGETYQSSRSEGFMAIFLNLTNLCILLSANLGVMNLLPIPALDGGRLIFLILEVFRGKPVDQAKEGLVHMIGLIALMLLMAFIMFNDINRLF